MPTLPEQLNAPQVFSRVRVTRSLVLCVFFCRLLFVLLFIVLSVILCFMDSDYPFGFSRLFLARSDLANGVVYSICTIIYVKCVSNLHQISTFLRVYHSVTLILLQVPTSEVLCDMKTIHEVLCQKTTIEVLCRMKNTMVLCHNTTVKSKDFTPTINILMK